MAIDRPNEPERPVGVDNPEMGWGSDVVAEVVRQLDIPYIAMVPGASYRGFQDSLVNYLGNRDPQMLVCLHEEHCVAIAHGYAKVTDKPMPPRRGATTCKVVWALQGARASHV